MPRIKLQTAIYNAKRHSCITRILPIYYNYSALGGVQELQLLVLPRGHASTDESRALKLLLMYYVYNAYVTTDVMRWERAFH